MNEMATTNMRALRVGGICSGGSVRDDVVYLSWVRCAPYLRRRNTSPYHIGKDDQRSVGAAHPERAML